MFNRFQNAGLVLAALAVCASPAFAQITVGQDVELSSGGDLSFGYSGSSGTGEIANHSFDLGGHGWLRGYYYRPQFLSFDFQPYYRRSQNQSIFQTISNGSGFTANSSIFSGSHFPGSVSFGRSYDSSGQFGVPGITGITSHGNGDSFSVSWSALFPNLPTLTANFSTNSGVSNVYGTRTLSTSDSKNLTFQSTYRFAGFDLTGEYFRLTTNSTFPSFFETEVNSESRNRNNAFLITAGHQLPMRGHWNLVWNRSNFSGIYRNGTAAGLNNGVVNDLNSTFTFTPTPKLGLMAGGSYNDNAFGALQQSLLEAGGILLPSLGMSLKTLSINGQAGYEVIPRLSVYFRANHHERWSPGFQRGITQFSGNAAYNFARPFLGALNFSVGVIDTYSDRGNTGASLVGNLNYLRRVRAWEFGSDFNYSQQIQTLFAVYTTSTYRYGASVKRRFNGFQWMNTFNGSHSGLTQFEGYSTRTETLSTNIIFSRFSVNGHYTQSTGTSLFTPSGLIEVPPGVPLPLLQLPILYDATSYGGGGSFRPFRRGTFSVGYNKAHSATAAAMHSSGFDSTIFNSRFQYRLRKLTFEANFTKFRQEIVAGTIPAVVNSYYIRFSRWFNLF